MTDEELKLECLKLAVAQLSDPNKIQNAQRFYDWVTVERSAAKIATKVVKK